MTGYNEVIRIPDDVWENRCQWCKHRRTEENRDVMRWETGTSRQDIERTVPCRIMSIARFNLIPGECKCFAPHEIYGICMTCERNNIFNREHGFCYADERPNYRQIYIGEGYQDKEYYGKHSLSTCDNYRPGTYYMETMRRLAAEGRIPKNFDPETMKPIQESGRNEAAVKWARVQEEYDREEALKRAEEAKALEQLKAEYSRQIPGQVSMEELL